MNSDIIYNYFMDLSDDEYLVIQFIDGSFSNLAKDGILNIMNNNVMEYTYENWNVKYAFNVKYVKDITVRKYTNNENKFETKPYFNYNSKLEKSMDEDYNFKYDGDDE